MLNFVCDHCFYKQFLETADNKNCDGGGPKPLKSAKLCHTLNCKIECYGIEKNKKKKSWIKSNFCCKLNFTCQIFLQAHVET